MNNENKITLHIELDPEHEELKNATSVRINRLLKYGKLMEEYMKNSQADIQTNDITEKVNNSLINKINDVQYTLINKVDTGITTKLESVSKYMSEQLTTINSQMNNTMKTSMVDIASVITQTESITRKIQDLFIINNQSVDKTNQQLLEINNDVNKELTNLKSHVNDIMVKYNSKDNIANLHQSINSHVENLKLSINNMINANDSKSRESEVKFREDLVKQLNDIKLQMVNLSSKTSARDSNIDLLNANVQKDINDLKLQIIDTIRKNMEEKGVIGKIEEIKNYIDKSKSNSATKGKVMEAKIGDILQAINEDYKIDNTSSKAKQSDFQLTSEKYKILVEVKDYDRNLPTAELDKFKYNVKTIACDGGIILNDKFGFAKFKFNCLKIIEVDNKPVIMLSKFNNSKVKLQMALRLLELAIDIKRKTSESKENNRALELEQQLTRSNNIIKDIEDKNKKARVIVDNFIKQQINTINNFRDQVVPLIFI